MSSCSTNCRPRQTHDCFATKPHRNRSPSDTADLRAHTWIDDDDPFWRDPRGTLPVSTSHLSFHTVTEEREASTGGKLFRRAYALINIEGQLQPGPLPHLNQKYPLLRLVFRPSRGRRFRVFSRRYFDGNSSPFLWILKWSSIQWFTESDEQAPARRKARRLSRAFIFGVGSF